jgi:electron transport protein HydN
MKEKLNSFVAVDVKKCIGCKCCEVACFVVHNKENNVSLTVGTVEVPVIPRLYVTKKANIVMPIQCKHCENAPCANSCPVKAIEQENEKILIDEKACIGCKCCLISCPFGAIDMAPKYENGKCVEGMKGREKIVAVKCDLCHEICNPACIEACPKDALTLINSKDVKKKRNKLVAENLFDTIKNYR